MSSPPRNAPPIFPWLNRPPPPPAPLRVVGEAPAPGGFQLRPGPRWSCWGGHSHVYRPQPYPGAPAFAYEVLALAEFTPIGAGTHNRDQLRFLEGTSFAMQGIKTAGLGGLVRGQIISGPLVVPSQFQSEDLGEAPGPTDNWIGGD